MCIRDRLESVYIANYIDDEELRTWNVKSSPGMKQASGSRSTGLGLKLGIEGFRKTVITFDRGGLWTKVKPPSTDANGKPIDCIEDECSLHLHLHSSKQAFGPFYSTSSSLGIVLATGNVGKYLSTKPDQINTYLSRDGGLNWIEIAKGSHMYEIGDFGGIIVIASDQFATMNISYSLNQGLTWNSFQFSSEPIEVENIVIEPTNTGEIFILYGENANGKGVLVALDLSTVFERPCIYSDPKDPGADYEYWAPRGWSKCLLGHQNTYIRRKREAECLHPDQWLPPVGIENCPCTEEDWECDSDFLRSSNDGPCLPIDGKPIDYSPPAMCEDTYTVSQGYRKIAGDTCFGGVDHGPLVLNCPGRKEKSKVMNFPALLLVSTILLVGSYLCRAKLIEVLNYMVSSASYVIFLIRSRKAHIQYEPVPLEKELDEDNEGHSAALEGLSLED
eukprot:TRINITY_DN19960_c0_g1_i1.p1 TRINITY_DN19960_c0_g1~~TRINITY_DN19960_c0_g1_i1.p1  ORF type:complete len:466 (+),score=44.82 TRINITY_DN19960_c0_g1_i1:60-1400(+)